MAKSSLSTYRSKRDFSRTAEPSGDSGSSKSSAESRDGAGDLAASFVVQRHRATARHYDFRLEVDGVLASWAVPKGPTLDPDVKSLAVHVEDHPLEYAEFEGVIPHGEYGGGDVIVWDRGTWHPTNSDDPAAAIEKGELHFDLAGERLAGRFALIRTKRFQGRKQQWLLIKKHDDDAVAGWNPEDHPTSVKSGRTNDEVAADPEFLWHSDQPSDRAEQELTAEERAAIRGQAAIRDAAAPAGSGRSAPRPKPRRKPAPKKPASWRKPSASALAKLDDLGKGGTWAVGGEDVKLTNLDKVLFPADKANGRDAVTKRDLVRYYATIAPVLLPYLSDRPVNVNRHPDGSSKKGFWQKAVPNHAPDWVTTWRYPDHGAGETEFYAVIDSPATLVWEANQAAVELHPWTSAASQHDRPTWALVDIDPGPRTEWADVVLLAQLHRTALDHLGVVGLPKVTGQRGIQIWIPVEPRYTFDETRSWVEKLSRAIGASVPDLVSWQWHKGDRSGLARLDYTQNAINKTLVAPYSPRPAPGAPVSVPLRWAELDDPDLRPDRWDIRTVIERLSNTRDPFARLLTVEQDLPPL